REVMQTPDGRTFAEFLDFFPELNSAAACGREAIREVTKAQRLDDPFAFLDQRATGKHTRIDTTPALPEPPPDLVESAARALPTILANVQPRHDGAIALVASNLVKRLQDARHTLAAAQWAIHEAIQAGRLLAGLVAVERPGGVVLGPLGREWHGGEPGTV